MTIEKIHRASDKRLRDQITKWFKQLEALIGGGISDTAYGPGWNGSTDVAPSQNAVYDKIESLSSGSVSDDPYDATTWNGVTTIAPSKNAVRDQFEVLGAADTSFSGRLDDLEGYRPGMMQYDGSTGYYIQNYTSSGNVITAVVRFALTPITGDTQARIFQMRGSTNEQVFSVIQISTDNTTYPNRAGRLSVSSVNNGGTALCLLVALSSLDVFDGEPHTLFYSFNATTGAATFVIDGVAADDAGNADRVAPTTGTLSNGAGFLTVGADNLGPGNDKATGLIGFAGTRAAYLTNWSDFMESDGSPKDIDEDGWTEWGSQPIAWNPHGQMDRNFGSLGAMDKTGSVELYMQGVESAWTVPDEELDGRIITLEGYRPAMMRFDGSTGYYSDTAYTSSGNKVFAICRFRKASYTGGAGQVLLRAGSSTVRTRIQLAVYANDHATAGRRQKIQLFVQNSAGTSIASIWSSVTVTDGLLHTVFASYDGDSGLATLYVDGVDVKDTGNGEHVLTTGTLGSGASSVFHVGSTQTPSLFFDGTIGFVGHMDAYLTNVSDFMETDGAPKEINETTWNGFGAQPHYFNPHGQMTNNKGSGGNMTLNGTILVSMESFGLSTGLVV